jgi:peptidoglycan/xylan/chitin deacetylase (PgdA/CDA1 family)
MVAAAAAFACARPATRAPVGAPTQPDAAVSAVTSVADAAPPGPRGEPTVGEWAGRSIEIACNGADDDHDGLTDVLLPVGPNVCTTTLTGACATGIASCIDGNRVCMPQAATPEVMNGVDDDCNGKVDDVAAVTTRPRALILAPRYAWTDAAPDIAMVTSMVSMAGIPHDLQPVGTDWGAMLSKLDRYSLAIVPGYLLGSAMGIGVKKLQEFANRGGVVVVFKPVGSGDHRQAWELTGLKGSTRTRDVSEIRFSQPEAIAVSAIDSVEERTLRVNAPGSKDAIEVYALDPNPAESTQVLARIVGGATNGSPAVTRRPLGKGAVYAIGHDLATFGSSRCYVNCFEPSGDIMRLVFDGALREGSAGHVALLHSAPSDASSVLLLTHDVSAPDGQNEGAWGPAGAVMMAEAEHDAGVRATYNITTDSVYYNRKMVERLCALGMCSFGAHGVKHPDTFAKLPRGTCTETSSTYGAGAPTLCGEIRVSMQLLGDATGRLPRVWRSPYLAINPLQYEVMAAHGIAYDSGFAVGDLPYNMPIDLSNFGMHQNRFRHAALIEFPIAIEDGLDVVDAQGKHNRVELSAANREKFLSLWSYILLQNARNRSFTTALVHPSRGRAQPPENLAVKVAALRDFLRAASVTDSVALPLEEAGDFWRARLSSSLDASYDDKKGYAGTLTIGAKTAPGLTLEFGDDIKSFTCASCGETKVKGRRVTLVKAPAANAKLEFTASVR